MIWYNDELMTQIFDTIYGLFFPRTNGLALTPVSLIVKRVWLFAQWQKVPGVLLFVAMDIV